MKYAKWFIVGGAGGIGSNFVIHLLGNSEIKKVTIYDNFSSGKEQHYAQCANDPRLNIIRANVEDTDRLTEAMLGHEIVLHLASNPNIAAAITNPSIDFWQGSALTNSVLEAMRRSKVNRLCYASGSGVYGDIGYEMAHEDRGPLLPTSPYGASKLCGEALISAYTSMFGLTACIFRFANVIGKNATHGVTLDFTRNLLKDPKKLRIFGNGLQSKSYIHVSDIINGVLLANEKSTKSCETFNIATDDYISVKEIAEIIIDILNLDKVEFEFTGGNKGWAGDIPVVRLSTERIKSLGWKCSKNTREAVRLSIQEMLPDIQRL